MDHSHAVILSGGGEAAVGESLFAGTEGVALGGFSADDVSDDAFDDVWASGGNELDCLFGGDGPVAVVVPLYPPSSSTSLAACHKT